MADGSAMSMLWPFSGGQPKSLPDCVQYRCEPDGTFAGSMIWRAGSLAT